ncbi:MAG TPA: rod-binding protein [Candidatus Binatia bacterium]|nr:rod-binding protein [Candidatus Binatia bacterium]
MSTIVSTQATQAAPLTPDQTAALARLHQATQQFEGVFLGMLLKEMRATVPQDGIFGKASPTTQTFTEMLDQQRAQQLASSGTVGISKLMEQQLRAAVLANAGKESKANADRGFIP